MLHGVQVFVMGVLLSLHLAAPVQPTRVKQPAKTQVQGLQTHRVITVIPTILPTQMIIPKVSSTPKGSVVPGKKTYGAWYWQSSLGRAQMWVGTDAAGKDMFVDSLPTPTTTPQPSATPVTWTSKEQCQQVWLHIYNAKFKDCPTFTNQWNETQVDTSCAMKIKNDLQAKVNNECK